jgi:hypothetical protein
MGDALRRLREMSKPAGEVATQSSLERISAAFPSPDRAENVVSACVSVSC